MHLPSCENETPSSRLYVIPFEFWCLHNFDLTASFSPLLQAVCLFRCFQNFVLTLLFSPLLQGVRDLFYVSRMSIWPLRCCCSYRPYVMSFDTPTMSCIMSIWLLRSCPFYRAYVILFDTHTCRMSIWLLNFRHSSRKYLLSFTTPQCQSNTIAFSPILQWYYSIPTQCSDSSTFSPLLYNVLDLL